MKLRNFNEVLFKDVRRCSERSAEVLRTFRGTEPSAESFNNRMMTLAVIR